MKFKNIILGIALVGACVITGSVRAQDLFAQTRSIVLASPTTLNTIGTTYTTNGPIDVRQFDKKLVLDIFSVTNVGQAAVTVTFQVSDDKTNWVAIPNYAQATATSVSTTNYWGGYSNVVTETVLLPGTWVTPTAYSAGWVTGYLSPAGYTNSGAVNVALNGITKVAYPVEDGRQYLRAVITQSGGTGATNVVIGINATGVGTFPPGQ